MTEQQAAGSEIEKNLDAILDHFLTSGGVFKDAHAISDEEMEAIYSVAYNLYENGKYDDALQVFKFLCFFDHMEKKYWLGLGAVRQMLRQYDDAVNAYSMAAMLDIDDPAPASHAADCLLLAGKKEEAESALNFVLEFAPETEQGKPFRQRAESVLGLMEADTAGGEKKENG
jgi:type III secretion system low calcium response chaperone LcrH/SycD